MNTWTSDWIEFYGVHRLGYQLKLARQQFGDSLIYEKGCSLFNIFLVANRWLSVTTAKHYEKLYFMLKLVQFLRYCYRHIYIYCLKISETSDNVTF